MDEQGWKTIETFEAISAKQNAIEFSEPDVFKCDHGVLEGDFCEVCNAEYKQAMSDPDNDVVENEHDIRHR